jgi:hypothetical protein
MTMSPVFNTDEAFLTFGRVLGSGHLLKLEIDIIDMA